MCVCTITHIRNPKAKISLLLDGGSSLEVGIVAISKLLLQGNTFWSLSCFVVWFMSHLSVLIKTHPYISLTILLLKSLANT